ETFHITSDELLTWNQIFAMVANAAGVEANIIHIPSDFIASFDADWGAGLLGDKTHSMIFDNSKIKRVVPDFVAAIPFAQGVREILAWYDADPARQAIHVALDQRMDDIIRAYEAAWS
ncbi:MAG: NAD-dependent dehydratase, partial [Chloroflexi bacterium]|nr:NAD-dependent dehydratase [Chloroflexota bacterium]